MIPIVIIYVLINFVTTEGKISERQYVSMLPIFHLDDFDKCMLYGENFFYCMITLQLKPTDEKNSSYIWNIIKEVNGDPSNFRHDLLKYGICIPQLFAHMNKSLVKNETKLINELNEYYNQKYKYAGLKSNVTKLLCQNNQPSSNSNVDYHIFLIVLILLYVAILISATLYEMFYLSNNSNNDSIFQKVSLSLSLRKNWQRFTCADFGTEDMNSLRCIQGFRVFNTIVVIVTHTVAINSKLPIINPYYIESETRRNGVRYGPSYSMQTFFMISSLLLCYQFLLAQEKGEQLSVIYFFKMFIKRYMRLTPTVAFSIAFISFWMFHLNNGPLWKQMAERVCENCREYWWTNLLYVNNYLGFETMCLAYTWYLAVNTQYFILSFIIFWIMTKYKKNIFYIFGFLVLLHVSYLFLMFYTKNYPFKLHLLPRLGQDALNPTKEKEIQDNHTSGYINSGGLIIGLIFGYFYYINRNKKLITKKIHVILWWSCILLVPIVINIIDSYTINNRFYNALYGSSRRIIFVTSQGVLFWGMSEGQGWILKWLSENSFICMLGRLTYSAYIIHPCIQLLLAGGRRTPQFFSGFSIIHESIRDIILSFFGALIILLFIEMPLTELTKNFTSKQSIKKLKNY